MKFIEARGVEVWEKNPAMATFTNIEKMRKKYGDDAAGEGLFAVYLVFDPNSPYRTDGKASKEEIKRLRRKITDTILKPLGFTFRDLDKVIEEYEEATINAAERMLINMRTRLDKLHKVLDAWHPDQDDAGAFASAAEKAEKMEERYIKAYANVLKLRGEEQAANNTRGGGELSLLESIGNA